MTIFICDGKNILMDRVTQLCYAHGEYNLVDSPQNENISYFENKSKLQILDPTKSARSWGVGIKLFTGIGTTDDTWNSAMRTRGLELEQVVRCNGFWGCHSKDQRTVWLDEEDTINQYYFDKVKQEWCVTEAKQAQYCDYKITVEGYNRDLVYSFMETTNVRLTAIEALVLAQSTTDLLGRRFDHYHIPTGKITYGNDLSDRQRVKIIDGIEARVKLPRIFNSVYLSNTVDGK